MAKFRALTVTDVKKTIRDAVVVTLVPKDGAPMPFVQGQYLTFRQTIEGTELRRSYSICSCPEDGVLQVGIKRVDGGAFSSWANDALSPGMVLEALPPAGQFHSPIDTRSARHYLGFAGGSGITPVLSNIRTILACEPGARFTLVYANRGVNTIMFREELEALKNTYMQRLSILHILESDAQDIELFQGRVDGAKCAALFERWIDVTSVDLAFICGPEPMMLAIAEALRAHGLDDDQIKYELFTAAQTGRVARRAQSATQGAHAASVAVAVTLDGATRRFDMARDMALLDGALAHDMDVPFACKAGVCSTCKCKVLDGEVEMVANHALEDGDVSRGYILSCQSYAVSDRVVLDYDQ